MSNPADIDLSPADILVGSMTLVVLGGLVGSFLKLWAQGATFKMFIELYNTRHLDLEKQLIRDRTESEARMDRMDRRLSKLENGGHPLE